MFSVGQTLCLESVWLTVDSNFLFRDVSGLVSSITISSEIWPAGTATTKYVQMCFKILNQSLKRILESNNTAIYSLCCPCIVTKNFCPRLPCWSVTMVITLWPSSPTRCWIAESTESAAITLSPAPKGMEKNNLHNV